MSGDANRITGATCLGCGCTCDDIITTVQAGQIVGTDRTCALGAEWFSVGPLPRTARVEGRETTAQAAVSAAARVLSEARRPLIYLAPDLSCEAQREAIAVADALRAVVDHGSSWAGLDGLLAGQERGRAAATLGEVKNRADLLIFWGIEPQAAYPRFQERYGADAVGEFVTDGRRSRRVISVDIGGSTGPRDADARVTVEPADEPALLEGLRAGAAALAACAEGGPWQQVADIRAAIAAASYVVVVAEGGREPTEQGSDRDLATRLHGLLAFTQAANEITRCAFVLLRGAGNGAGAEVCLTSQTGYPTAVDFTRGYPRYRPFGGRAIDRLAQQDVDVLLIAGATHRLPAGLTERFRAVDYRIVLGPRASLGPLRDSAIVIDGGLVGVDEDGLVYRMDDVPIDARRVTSGGAATAALMADLRVALIGDRL